MEQIKNQTQVIAGPEAEAPAWRSFGSVARQLVARAEGARPLALSEEATPVEFLAWAAE